MVLGRRNQGSEPCDESERRKLDGAGTIKARPIKLQADVTIVEHAEPVVSDGIGRWFAVQIAESGLNAVYSR
jgi:hypothetical protein